MSASLYHQVLVATLGTRPQVITLAVDLLAEDEGIIVDEVHVVHTAVEGLIGEALERLRKEFHHNRYQGRRCAYHEIPILNADSRPVRDIRTAEDASNVFRTMYRLVLEQKKIGHQIHLSIAGGRNSMVVYGAATAQILFDASDHLWYVISTDEFERSDHMHRRSRPDAALAPVPVLRWGAVSPVLTALVREQDPFQAVVAQERLVEGQVDRQRAEFLTKVLTPAEGRIVEDFVTHGGTDREIAARLARRLGRRISGRTVSTHLQRIYGKMQDSFGYSVPVNRGTVMQQFAGFFDRHPHLKIPST